jgi:PKD repeat protein
LGSQDENDFEVICEIRQNSTLIYSETKNIPQLDSMDLLDVVFTDWTPQDAGEYQLKIYTQLAGDENPDNDTEIRTVNVTTFNADFTSDMTQGVVPLEVKFSDFSIGDVTEWFWDFGDGNVSNEQNPTHTYNSHGTYTVSLTISNSDFSESETKINYIRVLRKAPDIFGIETANHWTYQGTYQGGAYTYEAEVVSEDQTTFSPITTYVIEYTEDGILVGKNWYETTSNELKLWGEEDYFGDFYGFSKGLFVAWYPMQVSDHRVSSATVSIEGFVFNVSMTVDVLIKESLDLGFDTLEAYKLRYIFRVWGHGLDESATSYRWVVPYLGFVRYQNAELLEVLTDFTIGGGTITPTTDADEDGLKDYEELIIYETNWQESDTDSDGLTDGDEVNTYGTDPNNEDSDNDGLNDGDEVDTHDTDPLNEDTDNDGLTDGDEINTYNTNPKNEDSDGDDLQDGDEIALGTNPNNPDTDGDGMPDGWEDVNDLDPLTDDADDDADGDGLTNLQEYNLGRHPTNVEPDAPVLLLPEDIATEIVLTPDLQTQGFEDTDGHNHAQSRWQISTVENDFSESALVLDIISDSHLTSFSVPEFMLSINTIYYWRVKFYDDGNAASDWSGPFSFKTITTDESDQDQNGIPDDQEIDDPNLDLDNDGNPDINQDDMKCVNTDGGAAQIGVKEGTNVTSIESLMWTNPDTIDDTQNKPDDIPLGLVSFKVLVASEGDTAEVTVYLSEPAPADAIWYKYDTINGWVDYSAHAVFSADRTSVTLQFMDGGFGDADGVANAIIIDPSGIGVIAGGGGGGGGGGGCFVSNAALGLRMPKESLALVLLFGFLLMGLLEFRKKFKK